MKRFLFAGCVLLSLGWTGPAVASTSEEEPEARQKPGVALWVEPVLAVPAAMLSTLSYGKFLMLPLGLSVPLGPRLELVVEATPFYSRDSDCDGTCASQAFLLAVGMSWLVVPERAHGGFFVQPKLVAAVGRDDISVYHWENGTNESWSATWRQLSVGLDVGYRFPFRHLMMEFILGGSVGRGWNVSADKSNFFGGFLGPGWEARTNKWIWGLNPNLFRIGGRF